MSMHRGGAYLSSIYSGLPSKEVLGGPPLSLEQASKLAAALDEDAGDYYYSACVSVADAVRGLLAGLYTWATVKLYYSVFYSCRTILARNGTCVFHYQRRHMYIASLAGSRPRRVELNTHKAVLKAFAECCANDVLVSQNIGVERPLDWLMARREEANYRLPRFCEPDVPAHFAGVESYGVRRLICEYAEDKAHRFTFDPDHAMLAYPLKALESARHAVAGMHPPLTASELAFMRTCCKDKSGVLIPLVRLFSVS